MELVELTKDIITSLVEDEDIVEVRKFETDEENTTLLQVLIAEKDMARVIGKKGKVINSVRTLVQASSYLKENKKIRINIDSI
jgi:predicted RNA-binding protein YlqC (UPF0109 family)